LIWEEAKYCQTTFLQNFEQNRKTITEPTWCFARDMFPSETVQTLTDHVDEVWFCRFSPDGKRLATGSKDGSLIIWRINQVRKIYFITNLIISGITGYFLRTGGGPPGVLFYKRFFLFFFFFFFFFF